MATDQHPQHQHAQWLASLATEHFVQQTIGSVSQDVSNQPDVSQAMDDESQVVDMSGQTVVKLVTDVGNTPGVPPPTSSPFNLRKKRKIEREDTSRHDEYKLIPSKDRGSAKNFDMRRPVRPIDRQKMRPWLKNLLDTGSVFGLNWLQREDGIFQISWRHASRLGWNLETDGDVFERWARHTGIFKDGDDPEPKRWKANFRCALHSLPDVKELTSPTDRKGRNASRTYRFLRPSEVQPPVKRKQRYYMQIPHGAYDHLASEDSGSQHGESDDRNTDEELFPEQARVFPHCDHDYAIRTEKSEEEDRTSEILSRHNSGYVLIKSKDAHEYEFRLTPPDTSPQPSHLRRLAPKPSPPKKGKVGKKKSGSSSPTKKGKGKAVQKSGTTPKKDMKALKKIKKTGEKEASPATKVSLKALLSGRKNTAAAKRAKGASHSTLSQASKKARVVKKAKGGAAAKGKGRKEGGESGAGTSSMQAQDGLQALIEAASQIDRLDALTSPSVTTPTPTPSTAVAGTRPSVSTPPASVASSSGALPLLQATPVILSTSAPQATVTSVAAPLVFATNRHALVSGPTTSGTAAFIPHTVLTPASGGIVSPTAALPAQVSHSMLQTFLGLSALPTATSSAQLTASGSSAVPVQVQSLATEAKTLPDSTGCKKGEVQIGKVVADAQDAPAIPLVMSQPETGMSMLKHLLRLTGPAMAASSSSTTTCPMTSSTPATTVMPATSQAHSPMMMAQSVSSMALKGLSATDDSFVKVEPLDTTITDTLTTSGQNTGDQADLKAYKVVAEYELGSSQEGQWSEEDTKSFPYIRVSTSKVYAKPEPSSTEDVPSTSDSVSSFPAASLQPTLVGAQAQDTAVLQHTDTVAQQTSMQVPAAQAGIDWPVATPSASPILNSAPRISLGLPQAHVASGSLAPTVTVTLPPQVSLTGSQGQAVPTTTYTQSMDLMQFLNLCAASGSNQVIIKTEAPISDDLVAMSSAYQNKAAAPASETENEASSAPKFILVDTSLQAPAAVPAGSSALQTSSGGQIVVSLSHPVLSAAANSPASSMTVANPTTTTRTTDITVSASEQVPLSALLQTSSEMPQAVATSANSVEVVANQYACIMNEADISSLSDQQGTDSFVVDGLL